MAAAASKKRKDRLAAALKENLKRRKAHARNHLGHFPLRSNRERLHGKSNLTEREQIGNIHFCYSLTHNLHRL